MEEPIKEQQSTPLPGNSAKPKLQRYPLRSGTKSKEEKPPVPELSNPPSSASKRGRTVSSVSKSVGVLDLSGKDKSAKPPRRLSIPTKNVSPTPKLVGNITPISEIRRRTSRSQGKSDTPVSEVSRSNRKTFNILFSTSYWLSQIKLSEAASKHSLSLGFFKLALEAGCKPLRRMRDELKAYIDRCNLDESEQTLKDLVESYSSAEDTEQQQVSETFSQGPEMGTRSSDDEVHSSSSTVEPTKLKPKSLNTGVTKTTTPVTEVVNHRNLTTTTTTPRNRGLWNKNAAPNSTSETAKRSVKKPQKPNKQEPPIQEKEKAKKHGKKQPSEKVPASTSPDEDSVQSNKENLETAQIEVTSIEEAAVI